MPKTLRSSARKLLYTMINNYNRMKSERETAFQEKVQLFTIISEITDEYINDPKKLYAIRTSIDKLKDLQETDLLKSETQYLEKTSSMTGVSMSSLWRVKKEGSLNNEVWHTPGKKRPHKPTVSNLDSFDMHAIRNKVNEFYIVKKQVPTLRTLLVDLRESIQFSGCMETLRQILFRNGFEFKKNRNERSVLIERHDIAAWRHKYLRTIALKRNENRPLIFLDETYVHQNYKVNKSWQGPSVSGVTDKISMGKRFIVIHAGSEHGFIPNAFLTFSTKSKLADYHHDMNASNFMKWLQEKLIPNLPQNSVVIMDNASYHVKQINKPPSIQNRKIEIQNWLAINRIPYEDCYSKAELLCLVNDNKPTPQYEVEELLKQHGHEVLKLPPYHCDLNPIEMIWSLAKRRIASKNIGVPAKEMEKLITESFSSISPNEWKKCTDHVVRVENEYKKKDRILENEIEPFIINVGDDTDSDNDSDDSFSDIEFLESDFDYDS